jgi:hypothetical protein
MARHNFLLQRHVQGPDGRDANCPGKGAEWRDTGTGMHRGHRDSYGNTGYGKLSEARADARRMRKLYPETAYRIIQIIS